MSVATHDDRIERSETTISPKERQSTKGQDAPQDTIAQIPTAERNYAATPPDGGTRAWLQVLAGHLAVFNTWGYVVSFGIFQPQYVKMLEMEPSAIAWIGSIQIFLLLVVGTFSGRAFDAGYFKTTLAIGMTLEVVGILTTSVGHRYWQIFLAQGVCQGLGCGIIFAPAVANISTYFSKKRTLAVSACACGGATGGLTFPLMAQQLLPKIGFAWTVRAMGLVVLVTSATIFLLVKPRLKPRKSGPIVELSAFKEISYLLFAISMFLALWSVFFAYLYARAYALDILGATQSNSFTMLLVIQAVGYAGRLVPAFIAQYYLGAVNTFIPVIFCAAICVFSWIGVHSIMGYYVWLCLYGFFGAAIQGMFPSTLAGLSKDVSKTGTRMGMIFTIVSIATLTGPPLAGKLIEVCDGSYLGVQIWAGSCLVLGGCMLIAARQASMRRESKEG